MRVVTEVVEELGIGINKGKSKLLMLNTEEKLDQIEEIEVVGTVKYLGMTISPAIES